MPTIRKQELIDRIAYTTPTKRALVKVTVQNFLDEIVAELAKGNRLEFCTLEFLNLVTAHQGWHKIPKLRNEFMSQPSES